MTTIEGTVETFAPSPLDPVDHILSLPRKALVRELEKVRTEDPGLYDEILQALEGDASLTWLPNEGPQSRAYHSDADVLFYGGAAGGGKSDLILGLSLNEHHRSIIFRVENTNNRGLIDRLGQILGDMKGFNSQSSRWRIPKESSPSKHPDQLIEFGSTPNPGDEQRHQGIPHDLVAFDEAAQFPEHVIRYLMTWNRPTVSGQRCRVVLTSNPPTPDNTGNSRSTGLWLISMFAPWLDPFYPDPFGKGKAEPGELRWFASYGGREWEVETSEPFMHTDEESGITRLIFPKSRTFIPALVTDNPFLVQDSSYMATLQALPEELRKAMLDGDFGVTLGDRPLQLFPTAWLRAAVQRHRDLKNATPRPSSTPMSAVAADVSRGGRDDTIVGCRHNGWVDELQATPGSRVPTGAVAAGLVLAARRNDADIIIDANGVGASCYDHLVTNNIPARAYVGSQGTKRRDKSGKYEFPNLRSAAYWHFRELLDPSNPLSREIALPDDDKMLQELMEHKWEERGGKIHIITKEKVTEQLKRSPDRADNVVMLFFYGPPLVVGVQYKIPEPQGGYRRKDKQKLGYTRTDWSQPLRRQQ